MLSTKEDKLTAKLVNNSVKLQANDINTFKLIQTKFSEIKINFHTFALREERTLKVLFRGIPSSFSEESVKEKLHVIDFNPKFFREFINDGRKLPMFIVTLLNTLQSKKIFKLKSFFYMTIRVEAYITSRPAQCHACQGFGHSSAHCGYLAQYVKCGKANLTKECKKIADQPVKCCNCRGDHSANYQKCPIFMK